MEPLVTRPRRLAPSSLGLLLIGVDHRSAPVDVREKVAYGAEAEAELLERLLGFDAIVEAFVLSTCNRTEIYLRSHDEAEAFRLGLAMGFTERAPEIEREGRFFTKRSDEAVRHLFEVASGLQSMVLGEPEILGQVRQAAGRAEDSGASGTVLRRLVRQAITAGGRCRGETAINAGAVSFGYAIVDLARTVFTRLEDCSVLLIGAGETGRLAARNLRERGIRKLRVSNRGEARLQRFLQEFPDAEIVPFEERDRGAAQVDIVVASTSAPEPILRRTDLVSAMQQRQGRPLLAADLGVPRNIERAAAGLENLFLQDIDTLEALIERNLKRRRSEVPRAQEILERERSRFAAWLRGLAAEPLVSQLQRNAEETRQRELDAVRERFPRDLHDELDQLTRRLVRRLLHHPSQRLRQREDEEVRLDLARQLFGLDPDPEDP